LFLDSAAWPDFQEIYRQNQGKKVVVQKGQLLTMDDVERTNSDFSKMSVSALKEMLSKPCVKIIKLSEYGKLVGSPRVNLSALSPRLL